MIARLKRNESGAYLILWALLVTALFIMVAMVIDLGRLRDTRRQSQRTADLAALAAGQDMAGGSRINGCKSAITYVKVNTRDISALSDTCSGAFAAACNPATPVDMVTTSGAYTVTVRSPIPDAEIEDPGYPPDPVTGFRVLIADGKPCERMKVTVQRTNSALFAKVIGVKSLTTRASAVIRGFVGKNPKQNAGLVVLERKNCTVIETGGQGSVLVKGSIASDGTPRPGIIQVDTKALMSPAGNCTNGATPAGYAVYGGSLPPGADRPGQPSVEAEAIGGAPGRLDMFALTDNPLNTHTAYDVPGGGVSPAPTPGVIASRRVVDVVYNKPPAGGGPGRVEQLKATSEALLTSLKAEVTACPTCNVVPPPAPGPAPCVLPAGGYYVFPPGTPAGPDVNGCTPVVSSGAGAVTCSTASASLIDIAVLFDSVYVNCPNPTGLSVKNIRFQGTKFVLRGKLEIGSGNMASFPNAQEIIVQGCETCSGSVGSKGIFDAGALLVNSGPNTPLTNQCNDGIDNDGDAKTDFNATFGTGDIGCQAAADWDELSCITDRGVSSIPLPPPARIILATGPFETSSSAVVELCQTFVLMTDGTNMPDETKSAATDNTCPDTTDLSGATVEQPCPVTNTYRGSISIFGLVDWIAPDQTSAPRNTFLPSQYFEDLAFWTETSANSVIKGAGATITGGVFFFPNALMTFSGQASQFIDLNAQFIARRLNLSGQGTLSMRPNPNDVVETPAPYFLLIR